MTTLLLDVGNLRLKWGLLKDAAICETGFVELIDLKQQGPALLLDQLPLEFESALACNVAGETIAAHLAELGSIRFVSSTRSSFGVTNSYRNPKSLGVDRWVALIGARAATDSACLVVDAGTAVTLDAIDPTGLHLGGQILPGFRLMVAALGSSTNNLPEVAMSELQQGADLSIFASSTQDAIAKGILGAIVAAVERGAEALRDSHADAELILTGGDAALIRDSLRQESILRPHLVLEGLAVLSRTE